MQNNLNEIFDIEIEKPQVLNDEYYTKEYFLIIKASNLEGSYQHKLGILVVVTFLLANLFNVMICTNKTLPNYFCVYLDVWEDDSQYQNIKTDNRYKLIHEEECVLKYCHVDINYISENINTFKAFNRNLPQLIVIDLESVYNIYTYFGVFCVDAREAFLNDIIVHIYLGSLIGYFIFPIISEYIGRQYSFTIIISILIICNIIFISLSISKDIFLKLLIIYSTCLYFITLSDIICLEVMSGELQKKVTLKRYMYYYIFSLCFTYFTQNYSNFKIISYVNIALSVITIVLSFKSIKETPKYLLEKKHFLRLRNILTKISKINNTYEYNVKEMFRKIDKQKRFSKEMLKLDIDLLTTKREKKGFNLGQVVFYLNLKFLQTAKNFIFFIPVVLMYLSINFSLSYIMFHLENFLECLIFFASGFLVYFYANLRPEVFEEEKIFTLKTNISILFAMVALICTIYVSIENFLTENFYLKNFLFFTITMLININRKNLDYFIKLSNCVYEAKELKSSKYNINDIHIVLYILNSLLMIFSKFIFIYEIPVFSIFSYMFYLSALISLIYLRTKA
jgi:hypothetical protein